VNAARSRSGGRNLAYLVDVRQNTSTGNGGADEQVELLVTPDRKLQVPGCDTLHSEIFRSVT
jgi:hypothetical protein